MSKLYVDEIIPSSSSNIKTNNGLGITLGSNTTPSLTFDSVGGIIAQQPYWNIVDQKANGTNAGSFTSGAWRTRDLNTTIGNNTITGSSLSSNQFTLPSGTYRINASSPAYGVNQHKIKLRNITDSTDVIIGSSENCVDVQTRSFLNGVFTISSSKTFEIQHYGNTTSNTNGFGSASSFSVAEIYTQVELWKLGN